ncbi:MAG: nitrile hydratase subunit alpha [Pseudonocardiaceae bacterium]|nr:nitrile hydratase subunit alpha [Pseudonocardiaceae bacterium]
MTANHEHYHHPETERHSAARTKAIESLLLEKGIIGSDTVDKVITFFETDMGPLNGAKVVARAWTEPQFREWLLRDSTAAVASMGFFGAEGEHIRVVANEPGVHHLIVCTLCSCYPWPLLGLPPYWFKDPVYRARAAIEPRAVLREFGLDIPAGTEIRVWDSSAQIRYMVLPERPAGTAGMSMAELVPLVTPGSMQGIELARPVAST